MRRIVYTAMIALLSTAAPTALAKKAHEHGLATLSIAVEGDVAKVDLDVPGDGVFGFEHAAKSAADKKTVDEALKTMRERGAELFVFAADKGCEVKKAEVELETGKKGHNDVEGEYEFKCKAPLAGSDLKLGLLKVFPRVKKVKVQVVSGTNQSGKTVSSADDALKL